MINNLINRLLDFKEKDEENEEMFILINTDSDNVGYGMSVDKYYQVKFFKSLFDEDGFEEEKIDISLGEIKSIENNIKSFSFNF